MAPGQPRARDGMRSSEALTLLSAVVFRSFAKEVPLTYWKQGRLPPANAQPGYLML